MASNSSKGFSLLEVMIAMVFLSITFMALLEAEAEGIKMCSQSKFITTATLLAEKHISEVKAGINQEKPTPGQKSGDFGADYPGYTYIEDIEATPLAAYYKYTLTVKFGTGKDAYQNKIITFIYAS
ncbi:MAG TPA: prepilin-type N-terminal cleavage/methylation domain-containing protein [Desulfomonilia bacterium]|jgi:prepilin-type N-terminal cleavage/methylation domain-containing protein